MTGRNINPIQTKPRLFEIKASIIELIVFKNGKHSIVFGDLRWFVSSKDKNPMMWGLLMAKPNLKGRLCTSKAPNLELPILPFCLVLQSALWMCGPACSV